MGGWRQARSIVTVVVVLAGSWGCALRGPAPVPPEQRAAYDAAMGHLPADPRAAEVALEAFLATHPRGPLADDALEQLAQIAFAEDRPEDGTRLLGRILSEHADGDRAAAARLRLAEIEYGRDKRVAARRLLEALDVDDLSVAERRVALRLRVLLSRTPVERLRRLADLRASLEQELEAAMVEGVAVDRARTRLSAVDHEIDEMIHSAVTPELESLLRELRSRPPASRVAIALARRALDAGQLDLAQERIDRADALARDELGRSETAELRSRLARLRESALVEADLPPLRELVGRVQPRTEGASGSIGVLLPLSGEFAAFGEECLNGILLAAGLFEADEVAADPTLVSPRDAYDVASSARPGAPRDVRLVVRDTAGDPARAAAAVRELAGDRDVLAIVGPVFSAESMAAADAAEAAGVPLVTLSTREGVASGRAHVFRTRTTPSDEIEVLVAHAFDQLGAKRFAVLYPETRYGRGMRKLYWDAVSARGGKVVAASSYDPEETDFTEPIRDMIGYRFLTAAERKALRDREEVVRAARRLPPDEAARAREEAYAALGPEGDPLPPIVDFDALFVPDVAETIAMVAPGLAFNEVRGVRLLGSSDWLDEELLKVARHHVSGAIVSASFYAQHDIPFVADFVARFERTFVEAPGAYSAQAFDATNLVLVQMAAGRSDREAIRRGLLDVRAYPGASGVLTMRPDGNARRRPFLLGVRGQRFEPLD
ncbi:MAG: ABC transporter substrate-binding protein [Myxococcota bacterium]